MASLMAGVSKVDITPPAGIFLSGFSARKKPAHKVHDRLYARILLFSNGDIDKTLVIICADLCAISRNITERLRKIIKREVGIPEENIMVNVSHTHWAPELDISPESSDINLRKEWIDLLYKKIADGVDNCFRNKKEVKIGFGKGMVESIAYNRRVRLSDGSVLPAWRLGKKKEMVVGPAGPVDPELRVLYLTDKKDNPFAVLFNYSCHPTVGGLDPYDNVPSYEFSASYPGYAVKLIENKIPEITAIFAQGCGGNIDPLINKQSFKEAERIGNILGMETIKVIEKTRTFQIDFPSLRKRKKEVPLVLREEFFDKRMEIEDEERLRKLKMENASEEEIIPLENRILVRELVKEKGLKRFVNSEVQVFEINNILIFGLPCEPFVEIGLEIKNKVRNKDVIVLGYCNDCFSYFPTPEAFREGGYEVEVSLIDEESVRRLKEAISGLLKEFEG